MKRWGSVGVTFVVALLAAGEASAGSIKLVTGGPDAPALKRKVIETLIGAGGKLSRCLRGHNHAVRVRIEVRHDGRTMRAVPVVRGRQARCVAGVIKNVRFRWTRQRWSAVVELSTAAPSDLPRRDMKALGRDLSPARDGINACARRSRASGSARFVFVVDPDGRLRAPRIETSRGLRSRVQRCMTDVLRRARVSAQPGVSPVTFRLALSFDNRGGGVPGAVGKPVVVAGPQPQSFGPHSSREIAPVMRRMQRQFQRCYARAKTRRKGDVVIRFTIRTNGTVRNVQVRKTTLNHKGVERCLVSVGKTLRFPTASGTTRVFYPFRFN
jgi:TonB family protein